MRDISLGLSEPPPAPPRRERSISRTALLGGVFLFLAIVPAVGVAYGIARDDQSKPRPASAEGLTIWSGGDSMSYYISLGLRQRLEPQGAVLLQPEPEYVGGSGLLSPDFYDWSAHVQSDVLPLDPGLIVFMVGANDANAFSPDDYRARVASMMDAMEGDGRYVVWVGQPNMQDAAYAERIRALNDVIRSEASRRSWVRYIDTWDVSSGPDGNYTPYLTAEDGTEILARDDDGIHLTPQGGDALSALILDELFGT